MDETEVKDIKEMTMIEEERPEISKHQQEKVLLEKKRLIRIIEQMTKIAIEKIKVNSRNKKISDIRKFYIHSLKKYTGLSNKEIAKLLEIGDSTISNVLNNR